MTASADAAAGPGAGPGTDGPLRLLTYNVRSRGGDAAAVAAVIRSVEPHVVCLQEAPRRWRWRTKCAALARRSGLVVVTGGRTAVGNLILSNLAVAVSEHRDVSFSAVPGLPARGAALAVLRWRGHEFAVAATHLDLEAAARLRHVGELDRELARIAPADSPTLIAGDINDVAGSAPWLALQSGRTDAFAAVGNGPGNTFPAENPSRRIDGVFVSAGIEIASATVVDTPIVRRASDHRPVLVELEF